MTLRITTKQVGQATLIEIEGRIDGINARDFQIAIDRELARPNSQLLLNMERVEYMSAAGLRILQHLHKDAGAVRLVNPSGRVREVLQITGLDAIYELYHTRSAAIQTINRVTNAHTHLELSWLADACPGVLGMEFASWVTYVVDRRWHDLGPHWEETFNNAVIKGIEALEATGTTMVADVTHSGRSIGPLLKSGLQGIVYIELIGTRPNEIEGRLMRAQDLVNRWRPHERADMKIGLSLHAPYSVHPDLWRRSLDFARAENLPLCIHVAESAAEVQFLQSGDGPLREAYEEVDRYVIDAPGQSPIDYLADTGALDLKPLLVHAVHVDDGDIRQIKDSGSAVVHCPRSNLRLHSGRMPLEKFLDADVPVFLGTDSLASSPSLNVLDEVEIAAALHHGRVPTGDIMQMVYQPLPGLSYKKG